MPAAPAAALQWALEAAEQAKIELSSHGEASIELPGGGSLSLTEDAFEALTAELFERMSGAPAAGAEQRLCGSQGTGGDICGSEDEREYRPGGGWAIRHSWGS